MSASRTVKKKISIEGGVAQMVERSLSMREVPGSIPGASKLFFFFFIALIFFFF